MKTLRDKDGYLENIHITSFKGGSDDTASDKGWVLIGNLFSPSFNLPSGTIGRRM